MARPCRYAEALKFGMVGVNEVALVSEVAPFGGWKQSGLGKENGSEGMEEFVEVKYICMGV